MNALADFLSHEAGQRRRNWLDSQSARAENALSYYLGPTGIDQKLNALAQALWLSDAGDVAEAADASQALWNDPSMANAGRYATAAAAMMVPAVSARMANAGGDVLGDALASGADDVRRFAADEYGGYRLRPDFMIGRAPYDNLRDRYSGAIDHATGGKDVSRVKLTPDRMKKAREYLSEPFPEWFDSADDWQAFINRPTKQIEDAKAFAAEAVRAGKKVRFKMPDGPKGSIYVRVGDEGTVRFADHGQPVEAGKVVGGYSSALGRRHYPASMSVDPKSGLTLQDALSALRANEIEQYLAGLKP